MPKIPAESDKLQLTLWRSPDGHTFVGDQDGREIQGVINMQMSCNMHQGNRISLECVGGGGVRELPARRNAPNIAAPSKEVLLQGHKAEEIKLQPGDQFKRVMVLKWPNDQPPIRQEQLGAMERQVRRQLGENTSLVCLPEGAELDIIELSSTESESPGTLIRADAKWNF